MTEMIEAFACLYLFLQFIAFLVMIFGSNSK